LADIMSKINKMKEISFEEILNKAKALKHWHFHMLGKDCKFNPSTKKFCIILEDEKLKEVLVSFFKRKPLIESKKLADLMYGKGFLKKEGSGKHNKDFEIILRKAKELTTKDVEWHHHHLHPSCIFNVHKGKHCIVLEDKENDKVFIAVYDRSPMKDLVKIEKLFYKK